MIIIWYKIFINKNGVALFALGPLQRQRNQVAEAALGHDVLIGEQAIVGLEPDFMAAGHCLREQRTAKLAGGDGRDFALKEEPPMPAVAAA